MRLIVDANVIFSLLIKEGKTADLFFNLGCHLYAPEFLLEEFRVHKQEILEKTKRSEENFNKIFRILLKVLNIFPTCELEDKLEEASKISPDIDDVAYFAMALKLKCPIWSNDKRLKEQNKVKIYSTEDIIDILF